MLAKSGRRYSADIIGLSSTTVTLSVSEDVKFCEIIQNKGYYAVQGHQYQYQSKPDFLLVINTN